jgi:hypothetical protein
LQSGKQSLFILNSTELTYLLNKPEALNQQQTSALEMVLLQYPFLQSARALLLKGLYNQNSFRYNYELKKTAAHTTDRAVLFDFITSEKFATLQKSTVAEQEKTINNIPVKEGLTIEIITPLQKNEIITEITDTVDALEVEETIPDVSEIQETAVVEEIEEIVTAKEPEEILNPIEEALEIGKPLDFNKAEKHSFQEWLQLTQFKPIERQEEEITPQIDEEKSKKLELIDKFIEANPKIPAIKEAVKTPVNISKSVEEPTHLMTETLAKVFLEQKKYHRAIQAYEILILKYPEKSTFFADRIKNIKDLQQNNNN